MGVSVVHSLARMCVYRIAAPGTVLMQQGDKHNHNFFVTVLRGHVSVVRPNPRLALALLLPQSGPFRGFSGTVGCGLH